MKTDNVPRSKKREEYARSDAMRTIKLPAPEPVQSQALVLKEALATEDRKLVQEACKDILHSLSIAYGVAQPSIKVLSARPREVRRNWVTETFGDYDFEKALIRLWMRTAVQKKATSYGTFLSTLCHEFCHHLDVVQFGFPNTFHTRGFYERAGLLYHHVQNTPVRTLIWVEDSDGTFIIDWAKTMSTPPRLTPV